MGYLGMSAHKRAEADTKLLLDRIFNSLLSESFREKAERYVVFAAIAGFLIHLALIALQHYGQLPAHELLGNPLVAIYTPFSIILLYEVYLLVYYIPKSITRYIGKQYEIITLIVIRKIFNDISKLEFTADWFQVKGDLQFTYDILASLILFFLISIFYRLMENRKKEGPEPSPSDKTGQFVQTKKAIAVVLVPLLAVLALYNLGTWIYEVSTVHPADVHSLKDMNNIFFDEFFTVLILTDVLLLLVSFLYSQTFHQVMRNSGFVISTVLIKMSFGQEGIVGSLLTVAAVLIGVIIMLIHRQYERIYPREVQL